MSATKTSAAFTWASGSSTASGTTNAISTAGLYAAAVYASIVEVGTASTAASFVVNQSPDGSTYYAGQTYTIGTAAGTYTPGPIPLDPTCVSVTITYTAESGGTSSTATFQLGEVTGV